MYRGQVYQTVKRDNPELKITEISKVIAGMWETVDAETKAKYQEEYAQNKALYQKRVAEAGGNTKTSKPAKSASKKYKAADSDEESDTDDEDFNGKSKKAAAKKGGKGAPAKSLNKKQMKALQTASKGKGKAANKQAAKRKGGRR